MLGSNPLPSTASFAARANPNPQTASLREIEHVTSTPMTDSTVSNSPDLSNNHLKNQTDNNNNESSHFTDPEFRKALDYSSGPDGLKLAWSWDETKQNEFISQLQPSDLSLILRKKNTSIIIRTS